MKFVVSFTLLFLAAQAASANEIVAVTEAVHIEDTGIPSMSRCYENGECYAWRTYYLFEVKVKRILRGQEVEENISFLYSAHAPNITDLVIYNNSLVRLVEIKDPVEAIKNIPAKYIILDWEIPKSKECFKNEFSREADFDGSMYVGGRKVICFSEETLHRFINDKPE